MSDLTMLTLNQPMALEPHPRPSGVAARRPVFYAGLSRLIAASGDKRLAKLRATIDLSLPMAVEWHSLPVMIDPRGVEIGNRGRPILHEGNPNWIVGHTERIAIAGSLVSVAGIISGAGEAARQVAGTAANGFPWMLELLFTDISGEHQEDGQAFLVRKCSLFAVSIVALATSRIVGPVEMVARMPKVPAPVISPAPAVVDPVLVELQAERALRALWLHETNEMYDAARQVILEAARHGGNLDRADQLLERLNATNGFASQATRRAKDRATSVSRSRRQSGE